MVKWLNIIVILPLLIPMALLWVVGMICFYVWSSLRAGFISARDLWA